MNNTPGAVNWQQDRSESAKNPLIPGARILRGEDARAVYVNSSAALQRFYALSEVNDLGMFSYIEKKASTDQDRPWATQAHPDINLYVYILKGAGTVVLGGADESFEQESYDFVEQELVIVPRGVPYRFTGEWEGICFHVRVSVFGTVAGTNRFPHPIMTFDKPARPTQEEREALSEPASYVCMDPLFSAGIRGEPAVKDSFKPGNLLACRTDLASVQEGMDSNVLYYKLTPVDRQTKNERNLEQARKNAAVLGARVIKVADSPSQYNANAGLKQTCTPLTWTDDIAIFNLAEKKASSDLERPFDSHSHPDIEEYKFIVSGSGTVTLGLGDETCDIEKYEFKAGDLVILPRGMPHVDAGEFTAVYFHAKQSVFGKTPGSSLYPHMAYVYTKPPRPTQEERDALYDPGTCLIMNSRETHALHVPNPILKVEKLEQGMKHLRPDLFSE